MKLLYGLKTPTPEYPQFIILDPATGLDTIPEETPSNPPTPQKSQFSEYLSDYIISLLIKYTIYFISYFPFRYNNNYVHSD